MNHPEKQTEKNNGTFETLVSLSLLQPELTMLESMTKEGETINDTTTRIIHEKLADENHPLLQILKSHTIDIPQPEYFILGKIAKDKNISIEEALKYIITEKVNPEKQKQIEISQAIVTTLEAVREQVNEREDLSELKAEIAGDLIVARASLEADKNEGHISPEKIKEWALELFA